MFFRPLIKINSHKFSKIQTYHLRLVQTLWEDLVRYLQNSWYKLCSSPTYPLYSHLQEILWRRNRHLKCNILLLFWTKFRALCILFTCTFRWSCERETWISSAIGIFWIFESYYQGTSILFTFSFRRSCERESGSQV